MKELIKIINNDDRQVVSSKELYKALEGEPTVWSKWARTNITQNPFAVENEDWLIMPMDRSLSSNDVNLGGRPTTDYLLTIPFAKKLAMMTRTNKGEEIRNYFIEIEKKYYQSRLPQTYSQALRELADTVDRNRQLESENRELKPKAEFYDTVAESSNYLTMAETAKVLNMGIGRNILFKLLREYGVLMANNEPYQSYVNKGWFRIIEQPYLVGNEVAVNIKVIVHPQKGVDGIRRLLTRRVDTQE